MKRSEMLKELANILAEHLDGPFMDAFSMSVAERVLDHVENKGMLPPERPKTTPDWEIFAEEKFGVWQWETENEQ